MLREFCAALLRVSICFSAGTVLLSPKVFAQYYTQTNLVSDNSVPGLNLMPTS
jgi:hypothetical protein